MSGRKPFYSTSLSYGDFCGKIPEHYQGRETQSDPGHRFYSKEQKEGRRKPGESTSSSSHHEKRSTTPHSKGSKHSDPPSSSHSTRRGGATSTTPNHQTPHKHSAHHHHTNKDHHSERSGHKSSNSKSHDSHTKPTSHSGRGSRASSGYSSGHRSDYDRSMTADTGRHSPKPYKSHNNSSAGKGKIDERYSNPSVNVTVYQDNAENKRLGRVGLPHGSAVHHRETVYKDTPENRKLDRVGKPLGSAVFHKDTETVTKEVERRTSKCPGPANETDDVKVYKDTPENRKLERVGKPLGSAVFHKDTETVTKEVERRTSKCPGPANETDDVKVYKDTPENRKLDRVGKPLGSAVFHKDTETVTKEVERRTSKCPGPANETDDVKVYKNTPENRKLDRVGKPLGSAVFHRDTGTVTKEAYFDTPFNRKHSRVGLPRGSKPVTKQSPTTKVIQKLLKGEEVDYDSLEGTDYRELTQDLSAIKQYARGQVDCFKNRILEEQKWQTRKPTMKTNADNLKFTGHKIPSDELDLYKKIGEGGFGEVYFAVWRESIVAVKRLKVGAVSNRRSRDFLDEIMRSCQLQHTNIVKFIGACLEKSNLSIIMEYMHMSLFEGLHIKCIILKEQQKISIIQQVTSGLAYLHKMRTAHCDLKPQNILLSVDKDKSCIAKITDFGLSMVRESTLTEADIERAKHVGTPRYSAPEVLRGELLNAEQMMKADVYSISLVCFEVICEEEPFYNLSYTQLQKQVGERGHQPEQSEDIQVKKHVTDILDKGLAFNANSRPAISEIEGQWKRICSLYKL